MWAAAEALMAASASYMDFADHIFYERIIAPACVGIDEGTIEAARAEGRRMSFEQIIPYALNVARA
jgi:ABC-type methionine transport system permease subunit